MGFNIKDSSNNNLGTIEIVEPDAWRGASHYFSNKDYGQNFYINCAARPEVQQNNADLQNEKYENPQLDIYDRINEFCVNYNNKWYKPLSILELPTFSSTVSGFKADEYYNDSDYPDGDVLLANSNLTHYGFYINMLNFGGSKRDHIHQTIRYTSGDSHFQINRSNEVSGSGILLWRIKTLKSENHTGNIGFGDQIIQRDRFHLNKGKVAILV